MEENIFCDTFTQRRIVENIPGRHDEGILLGR